MAWETLCRQPHTVFLGEAGCGKSELAVHLALELAEQGREVHFFDLDQTKPLMRSRDAEALLTGAGITVHFQQQCADAPTQVGGLVPLLTDAGKTDEAAARYNLPVLAKMPLDPTLAELVDAGEIENFQGHWLDAVAEKIIG